ncbi:MAG: hypothetical protein KA147_03625 [Bacteroidia bacterium]|nr:hypothetical protein [Bacteroidia bacterium]
MNKDLALLQKKLQFYYSAPKQNHEMSAYVSELLKLAGECARDKDDYIGKRSAGFIAEAIELLNTNKLSFSYQDWCNILSMQIEKGYYFPPLHNHASAKCTLMLNRQAENHPWDIEFIMAAIFMGFEDYLNPVYVFYYYEISKSPGAKSSYFKENSLEFHGALIPYHAVYSALRMELPHSIYRQTGNGIKRRLKKGMMGFPAVWSLYTWDHFLTEYTSLNNDFKNMKGRPIQPSDLIVAALTHVNRHHGLKLIDGSECQHLNSWMDRLPEEDRFLIKKFDASQRAQLEILS